MSHALSATEAAAAMRAGALSALDYAEACLARVAARDGEVRAWQFVDPERVRAQARAADARAARGEAGPLNGLPVGIKDVCLTADQPTQYNAAAYRGYQPPVDAAVVALLRAAGAVIFGKTHTVEFAAVGAPPPTRNPHHPGHTPGGSSSGSAAAVADGHVPLAIGTQTGGSIIRPASFCGVHALKPTWGTVSAAGAWTFAPSLDTVGWFARSIDDLQLLYGALAAQAEETGGGERPLRVAVCRTARWHAAGQASVDALASAAEALREGGATVAELTLPPAFDALFDLHGLVMRLEGGVSFLPEARLHGAQLHPRIRDMVDLARSTPRRRLLEAQDQAAVCRTAFDALAGAFDAVLTPSTVGEAPAGLAATGDLLFNGLWTLLHVPCVNVAGLRGPAGLPVGVTLTGPRGSDARVLRVARVLAGQLEAGGRLTAR